MVQILNSYRKLLYLFCHKQKQSASTWSKMVAIGRRQFREDMLVVFDLCTLYTNFVTGIWTEETQNAFMDLIPRPYL